MADFLPQLIGGIKSAYCFALGNNDKIFGHFYRANPIQTIPNTLDNISKLVCNRPESGQAPPAPSISGGQCDGVVYQVQDSGNNNVNGAAFSVNRGNRVGPIRAIENPNPPPTCGVGQVLARRYIVDGSGNLITQNNSCGPLPLIWSITATPLEPEPGGGCGDGFAPGDFPEPEPIEVDVDITYGDNNEFNLTVPVIFAPVYVSVDGSINVPITIPDLDLIGELNLNGEFNVDLGLGGNNPPNSGNNDPIEDPDDDAGDPDDEEEDRRPDIVGVFVVVTSIPTDRATFIPQSAGPNIIAPRAGSVKFKITADGRSGWTEDFPVKSSNAWIPVPGRVLATDVQVTPDFGSELTFRAVRERPEPT